MTTIFIVYPFTIIKLLPVKAVKAYGIVKPAIITMHHMCKQVCFINRVLPIGRLAWRVRLLRKALKFKHAATRSAREKCHLFFIRFGLCLKIYNVSLLQNGCFFSRR
jgi:hypothetical protein